MGADLIATAGAVAALIGGLSGALCGGLIAHRLTLQRDRRKECVELAVDLASALDLETKGRGRAPESRDLDRLALYLGWLRRRRYLALLREYRASKEQRTQPDTYGDSQYQDPDRVTRATRALYDFAMTIH